VTSELDVLLVQWKPLARCDSQLPFHEIEPGDHLGDRVLDL
jgi:hypothetical protein